MHRSRRSPTRAPTYVGRLVAGYRLDIAAAHALLGAHPRRARLVRVEVPVGYAHWVPPGACHNRVGYYEVPNSRLVYTGDGPVRFFGIASMISWRGVWYVVHLGAVKRTDRLVLRARGAQRSQMQWRPWTGETLSPLIAG